jgi:outer membrane protein TolC
MRRAAGSFLIALFALMPSALFAASHSAQVRALTLRDAITAALEKNENIVIERASFDSAGSAIVGARGAYDPLLTIDAGWRSVTAPVNSAFSGAPEGEPAPTDRRTEVGASLRQLLPSGALISLTTGSSRATTDGAFALLSPAYEAQLGVEFRQPLLRDREIDPARLTLQVTTADRNRAAGALRREISETIAGVERAYWNLVAARRAIAVQEEAVALASQQLDETRSRIESGMAPETETAQPQAELERRRGDLLASRAETTLKRLILGDDTAAWSDRLEPVEEISIQAPPIDIAIAMERALASRPELDVVQGGVERRRAESSFSNDRIRPALDLVVSYDRFGLAGVRNPVGSEIPGLPGELPDSLDGNLGDAFGQLGGGDFDDARVAFQLSVPIRNRAARAGAEIARNELAQAEAEMTQLRKSIRAEVLDAAAAAETAVARIDAARAAREAAEVQLAAESDRFDAGLSTNFLVLTRQNDLAAARLAEIEALTDYRTARTELARATGSLLAERRIELE